MHADCSDVDPKLLLLEIGAKMLHADLVERADDGPLEEAQDVFNPVHMTPAMAAGITNHVWTLSDVVQLLSPTQASAA